ncbi:hypothetical protein A2U01_0115364, partial [Trifolium medium]|nr:hypothetical protein [Trifolium medium]
PQSPGISPPAPETVESPMVPPRLAAHTSTLLGNDDTYTSHQYLL